MKRSKIDYEISGPKSNMAYSKKKLSDKQTENILYLKRKLELEEALSMIV